MKKSNPINPFDTKSKSSNLVNPLMKEYNDIETVTTLETILFTGITEDIIKSERMLAYCEYLDFVATENKLKASFNSIGFFGEYKDIKKANEILINSVKYN